MCSNGAPCPHPATFLASSPCNRFSQLIWKILSLNLLIWMLLNSVIVERPFGVDAHCRILGHSFVRSLEKWKILENDRSSSWRNRLGNSMQSDLISGVSHFLWLVNALELSCSVTRRCPEHGRVKDLVLKLFFFLFFISDSSFNIIFSK